MKLATILIAAALSFAAAFCSADETKDVLRAFSKMEARVETGVVRIPDHRDRRFRLNVTVYSGRT